VRPGYEGGQMPLQRRLPKRGFTNVFRKEVAIVNLRDLGRFETGSVVDPAALLREGLIGKSYDAVKLLGQGDVAHPLEVKVHRISDNARRKIEAAGGKVEVIQ
jgi:large subunit ribosomal protein L15